MKTAMGQILSDNKKTTDSMCKDKWCSVLEHPYCTVPYRSTSGGETYLYCLFVCLSFILTDLAMILRFFFFFSSVNDSVVFKLLTLFGFVCHPWGHLCTNPSVEGSTVSIWHAAPFLSLVHPTFSFSLPARVLSTTPFLTYIYTFAQSCKLTLVVHATITHICA